MNFFPPFFISASLPGTAAAHKLVVAIRQKCSPEDVLEELKDLPNPSNSENDMIESTFNPLKIDVFVQTLLNLGSKSFSHTFAAISKFHFVFKVWKLEMSKNNNKYTVAGFNGFSIIFGLLYHPITHEPYRFWY